MLTSRFNYVKGLYFSIGSRVFKIDCVWFKNGEPSEIEFTELYVNKKITQSAEKLNELQDSEAIKYQGFTEPKM